MLGRKTIVSITAALTAVCALAVGAGSAGAAPVRPAGNPQQWNPVSGDVNSDGAYTLYYTVRHVTTTGNVYLDLTDTVDGGFCVGLATPSDPYNLFAGPVCWSSGQYGQKTVATDVLAGTAFHVVAWKRSTSGSNNHWASSMFY